jgi:putative transposase
VTHRTNRYLNTHVEQDHRGIKQRYRFMGGFKHGHTAAGFCLTFDEVRDWHDRAMERASKGNLT